MSDIELDLLIAQIDPVAEGVLRFTLIHPQELDLPQWEPGAHIDIRFLSGGGEVTRQYSLCGSPADRKIWQFAVRLAAEGRGGSAHIHESFAINDTLRVSNPRNNFVMAPAEKYLFVAGGIGITPIIPMIEAACIARAEWRLIYCGRSAATMAFLDQVTSIGGDRVSVHESEKRGQLDLAAVLNSAGDDAALYCCGPVAMLDAVDEYCKEWSPERVHYERFSAREVSPAFVNTSFEVEFARSGVTVTIPANRTLLEVAEENGIDIDSSCQEGVCGSCETRIISGTADHRDSLLSAKERAAGKSMMVCVSRSCSSRLVLDA